MPKLKAILNIYKGKSLSRKLVVYPDSASNVSIGRQGFGAVIDLDSPFISRSHAEIRIGEASSIWLIDLGSKTGSFVNGKQIKQQILKNGDLIHIGGSQSVFTIRVEIETVGEDFSASNYSNTTQIGLPRVESQTDLNPRTPKDGSNSTDLISLLSKKPLIVIGRSKECDVVLPLLTITRKHAEIRKSSSGGFVIKDLGSRNGTFVNHQRINGEQRLTDKDEIHIGPYKFNLLLPAEDIRKKKSIALVAESLVRTVDNGRHTILRDVQFKIPSESFVAIMGPSGCGKSTLLRALNGDAPATSGSVFIHDLDLYAHYDHLKRLIGYVPQDDIVHQELSVEKSLFYAAKLRLSSDVSKEDIWAKIDEVLHNLNINDPEIRARKIMDLSGGQRKRVSIAVELLTDPSILFLDEPTSPLDPETIEDFLLCVRELAKKGTTILMVTHKPGDLYYVDQVLFLSKGGYMSFFGPKENYLSFFGAKNVIEVYSKNRTEQQGEAWAQKLKRVHQPSGKIHRENPVLEDKSKESYIKQWYWLTRRYLNIKTNDRVNTIIMLAQAPIIAGLVALIFDELELSVLFLTSISAIWFGTNNAAKEIVGEAAIYRRERMFNLQILPYLLSKVFVLGFFAFLQVLIFVAMLFYLVGSDELFLNTYWPNVGWMWLLSFSSILLGLLVSALVNTTEKVMTIVPIVLIPQIMLAGVITAIPEKSVVEVISYGTFSRWGTQGFAYLQDSLKQYMTAPGKPDSLYYTTVDAVEFMNLPNSMSLPEQIETNLFVLLVMNLFLFLGIVISLKRKDTL